MWTSVRSAALKLVRTWPQVTRMVPPGMRSDLRRRLGPLRHASLPDRRYMEQTILPAFAARRPRRLLFVGIENYTAHYPRWFTAAGTEVWSIDIEPRVAGYGAASRHIIGDVLDLGQHFPPTHFDAVFLNGLFGFGLDTVEDATRAVEACHRVMHPNSPLLLGWDADRFDDPLGRIAALTTMFRPTDWPDLPARIAFAASQHVYDVLLARRRDGAAPPADSGEQKFGAQGSEPDAIQHQQRDVTVGAAVQIHRELHAGSVLGQLRIAAGR